MSQSHSSRDAERWARSHQNMLMELGPPTNRLRFDGESIIVVADDGDGNREFETVVGAQQVRKMIAHGIINRVEEGVYRVNEAPYTAAAEKHENSTTLPCGHTGMRNLGGGDYSCAFDLCDKVYDRDTVEGVFG